MTSVKKTSYLLLVFSMFILLSCNGGDHQPDEKKYKEAQQILLQEEQQNPAAFITVSGDEKRNLIGQTVIRGKLFNGARVAAYKDISIGLSFYSRTKTLLETEKETIYMDLLPGETKAFKTKYFAPKGTDSVSFKILEAKIALVE